MSETQKLVGVVEAKKPDMGRAISKAKPDSDRLGSGLISAAFEGKLDKVKKLVAEGADVNSADISGETALTFAIQKGQCEMVRFLLEAGAKDFLAIGKQSAVKIAAEWGSLSMMKTLVAAGFEVDIPDCEGMTALMAACRICKENDGPEKVKLLISKGADVNRATYERGYTPLHYAVGFDVTQSAELLLQKGASVHIEGKNRSGDTTSSLLETAIGNANPDMVRILVREGAMSDVSYEAWRRMVGTIMRTAAKYEYGRPAKKAAWFEIWDMIDRDHFQAMHICNPYI